MIIEIKWNAKKMLKSKRIKETKREGQPKGQNYWRDKIPKGQKKREKKRIARQHKLNEGEERKVLWQLKRTFGVWNCEGRGLYL